MLRFRRPRSDAAPNSAVAGGGGSSSTTRKKKKNKKTTTETPASIFPPTIFTDFTYTRGILVPNNNPTTSNNNNAADDTVEEVVQIPNDYFGQDNPRTTTTTRTTIPALSENEAARWNDNYAAQAAARRRSPMNAVRLLGTITLSFEEKGGKKQSSKGSLFDQSKTYSDKFKNRKLRRQPTKACSTITRTVSKKQALGEATVEMGYDDNMLDLQSLSDDVQRQLERRADEIVEYWKVVKNSKPLSECWNAEDGGFVREAVRSVEENEEGEFYVPIICLLNWMKQDQIVDLHAGRMKSLYNGLRHVPTDALNILESLIDLSCPQSLYKIPLITPYAVAHRSVQGSKITWQVRIGVYMNRLLPEVLTEKNLHCVMSALDDGSFIVSEPLHLPPMRDSNDPVFKSSEYPIVTMPNSKSTTMDIDEYDMTSGEEKKEDDEDVQDPTVQGSTRESKTISPFTPKGYLKLLENTGNDISMFPEIASRLEGLKLDLMLHQQHAVCWMTQMEQLGGFGINSIIWEERTFLDGGKYYYSPALGQIRLSRPPKSVGGCLADEMGLGKTIEMLSLIASSLNELKGEARDDDGGDDRTHATLIIVPPALVAQWVKEITKSCGDTLNVGVLDANKDKNIDMDLVKCGGEGNDILITTYSALEKPKASQFLANWRWGRVVLDEQQEIRSSTTKIAKNCEGLDCHRRWMLSGTPLFEGVQDLRGELNFLRLVPYAAKWEDGFFDFSIMQHWNLQSEHGLETLRVLGMLILRRSKDMTMCRTGESIMSQKRLTVEMVPVEQNDSERALYCWFESIVSQEVTRKDDKSITKPSLQSQSLCLRLLREICFSACLINGGLGATSQMRTLNQLYRSILAREELLHQMNDRQRTKRTETTRTMSPLEALRFLSQADREANVREDFVSDVRMGRGQGAANRGRATDDIQSQVKAAQTLVDESSKKEASSRQTRAKKHWHLALELITTGALCGNNELIGMVKPSIRHLWNWRRLCVGLGEANEESNSLPPILVRGWRPSSTFAEDLLASNPSFHWVNQGCLHLHCIPSQVTLDEVTSAIFEASKKEPRVRTKLASLHKNLEKASEANKPRILSAISDIEKMLGQAIADDQQLERPTVVEISNANSENWMAYAQPSQHGTQELMRNAKSSTGIPLKSSAVVPHISRAITKAQERFDQCVAEYNVHPSTKHKTEKIEAQKALDKAKFGLTINFDSTPLAGSSSNVIMTRAMGSVRNSAPQTAIALTEGAHSAIDQASDSLGRAISSRREGEATLSRLLPALNRGVPQDIEQKSAYEVLESLRKQSFEETLCPICLGRFGEHAGEDPTEESKVVAMITCGHFFCIGCLDQHAHSAITNMRSIKCPNCRSGFNLSDVIHIDHLANDDEEDLQQRKEAKAKVREASDILQSSDGLLDAKMWSNLFLAIDVPTHVNNSPHHTHTALRRDVLSHFRAACGMEIDMSRNSKPSSEDANSGISSKILALLRDFPLGEHAVVFASSKEAVLHLATVIKAKGIGCFSLFTGQATKQTEEAVSSWENTQLEATKVGPVLVVQAGAAASGLTLTAASKLFLMEPFQRQEEEQQAYARCHRYGQKKDVHVKVYYSPVTVESRLLRWRRRSTETLAEANKTSYVFSQLYEEEGDEEKYDDDASMDGLEDEEMDDNEKRNSDGGEDNEVAEDNLRTQFLLGLLDEHGNPIGGEDGEAGSTA